MIEGDLETINIKQNLLWAFIYNTVGIPIATIGLLASCNASRAMPFSFVSVALHSLRLKCVKYKIKFLRVDGYGKCNSKRRRYVL